MELRVSSYSSRAELEAYCERLDPEQKTGVTIVGTIAELARFQLGPTTAVHGIQCKASDFVPTAGVSARPDRIHSEAGYGLNGQLIKPKE